MKGLEEIKLRKYTSVITLAVLTPVTKNYGFIGKLRTS